MVYFETPRLIFRDWNEQDLTVLRVMNADARVMKYFENMLTEQETDHFYNRIADEFKESGYGLYAVETKHMNEFIGFIGFHKATFEAEFTPCIEIGWRLRYEAWGNGYATEGAKACLQYGFAKLHFNTIYSYTAKINRPSEHVMQKIGMVKIGEFEHPKVAEGSPLREHILYVI
jgi:ribosomal-protein-alanine N-acetyltransferase